MTLQDRLIQEAINHARELHALNMARAKADLREAEAKAEHAELMRDHLVVELRKLDLPTVNKAGLS